MMFSFGDGGLYEREGDSDLSLTRFFPLTLEFLLNFKRCLPLLILNVYGVLNLECVKVLNPPICLSWGPLLPTNSREKTQAPASAPQRTSVYAPSYSSDHTSSSHSYPTPHPQSNYRRSSPASHAHAYHAPDRTGTQGLHCGLGPCTSFVGRCAGSSICARASFRCFRFVRCIWGVGRYLGVFVSGGKKGEREGRTYGICNGDCRVY